MRKWWIVPLAATVAMHAWGQARPPVANPLQTLPRVETPAAQPSVTLNVQRQNNSALQALLASPITPTRVDIVGVRSIAFDDVAALFKPLTGKTVTVGDVVAAADACSKLYQQRGYALSFCFVPGQRFDQGAVQVVAVEGYVAAVDIKGSPGNMERKIRAIARHITADRPLRRSTFERYLQVLGMLPGTKIAANVPAPTTTDGATRLQLDVQRKRYNVTSGIDFNHPGVQGLVNGMLNGMTPLGEQLNASFTYPRGRGGQEFYAAGYSQMLGSDGFMSKLDGSYFYGDPDIDNNALPAYIRHRLRQDHLGLAFTYPILLGPSRSLVAGAGLYGSNQDDMYLNQLNDVSLQLRTRVRVLHLDLDFVQASNRRVRKLNVTVGQGIDALGARTEILSNAPVSAGQLTDTRFTRYDLSASQSDSWGKHWGTVLSLNGQYSHNHLPSGEQISFGGPRYGMAYDPGTLSGDSGWGTSAELNRPFVSSLKWLKSLTPYVVAQVSRVYLHGTDLPIDTLRSVALGLRLSDGKHYNVDISAAQAIGNHLANESYPRYGLSFSYQLE
ncbi:ShlB/FhaC/HecB family hemolysin secretion/activation protein [Dyella sp.]|uniref:ShlB/FhaC/HecB family hemolysin secretion/activation protein n=1 Tax=Dyella sp. TaxID=1869338 RepID=UPI002ED1DBAA